MANSTGQDLRISIEQDVVSIAIGHGSAVVPTSQIEALVTALKAAQMLVAGAPQGAGAPVPATAKAAPPAAKAAATVAKATAAKATAAKASAPVAKAAAPKASEASAAPAAAAPAKRRGRPPKHVDADGRPAPKRRSRKRVGDALEVWLRANPGWYSEDALLALVKREQMTDADPHRALKIALGKQKGSLFVTDDAGNWSLAETAAKGLKPAARAKSAAKAADEPARKGAAKATGAGGRKSKADAKAEAAVKKTETAGRKRASAGPRKRQSAGAGKKADMEGSPAGEAATADKAGQPAVQGSKPLRVRKGQQREEVLHAGRPKPSASGSKGGGVITAAPEERERIRRNLFGE